MLNQLIQSLQNMEVLFFSLIVNICVLANSCFRTSAIHCVLLLWGFEL